ncbi:putative quinol monooxygenase [Hydrogenimonas sp. SS33]|uniref:putative quinol monooxygenase n=1 Tax=Hydrogenimonas leucolamina TaxID=2954236 RepID=UPI00336BC675
MSKKIYCIAQFRARKGREDELFETLKALEPDTLREDGCLRYVVTRKIEHPCAPGTTDYPIVFNEIWADDAAFTAHCRREAIQSFFQRECVDPEGAVEAYNVCVYTDEGVHYDAPEFGATCE